jgi:hypothetical protein
MGHGTGRPLRRAPGAAGFTTKSGIGMDGLEEGLGAWPRFFTPRILRPLRRHLPFAPFIGKGGSRGLSKFQLEIGGVSGIFSAVAQLASSGSSGCSPADKNMSEAVETRRRSASSRSSGVPRGDVPLVAGRGWSRAREREAGSAAPVGRGKREAGSPSKEISWLNRLWRLAPSPGHLQQ